MGGTIIMPECRNCGIIFKKAVGSKERVCEKCWYLLRSRGHKKRRKNIKNAVAKAL